MRPALAISGVLGEGVVRWYHALHVVYSIYSGTLLP